MTSKSYPQPRRAIGWSRQAGGGFATELECGHHYELHGRIEHRILNHNEQDGSAQIEPVLPPIVNCGVCETELAE